METMTLSQLAACSLVEVEPGSVVVFDTGFRGGGRRAVSGIGATEAEARADVRRTAELVGWPWALLDGPAYRVVAGDG